VHEGVDVEAADVFFGVYVVVYGDQVGAAVEAMLYAADEGGEGAAAMCEG